MFRIKKFTAVSKLIIIAMCFAGWVVLACTPPAAVPWGLPESTKQSVELIDLAGTWQLGVAEIVLNEDGTFEITDARKDEDNGHGTWSISEPKKEIDLRYDGGHRHTIIGWVIDSQDINFGIFGGLLDDPDAWKKLKKIN